MGLGIVAEVDGLTHWPPIARQKSGITRKNNGQNPIKTKSKRRGNGSVSTSMGEKEGKIWLDGIWVDWRDAKVHVLTHTLHYGFGVFEGIRCYNTGSKPAIFRLQEHIDRLFRSAHVLNMTIPYSPETVLKACLESIPASKMSLKSIPTNMLGLESIPANELRSGYIRPLVFFGSESMGLNPAACKVHLAIAAWKWGAYLGEDGMANGIRVKTSSYTRLHPNINLTRAKAVGNYPNSILAKTEALACKFDEALLLDPEGFVAEGSGENIFILRRDGKLLTPPLDSVLDGITRDTVITLAQEINLEVLEQRFTRDEVMIAHEAFFTGTAAEVTPIRELDGRAIGSGTAGPITKQIQKLFFDVVHGRHSQHKDWLTFIS